MTTPSKGKNITSQERLNLEKEMEQAMLIQEANTLKDFTLKFTSEGEIEVKSEIADMLLAQIDKPEEKYEVYYHIVDRLLRKHLPAGKVWEKHRALIYEEKNTFLTRGHRLNPDGRRGADSRQGYLEDMHELVPIITDWITNGANMFNLYITLRDLNKSRGYPLE